MKENNRITKFETFIIFCLLGIIPFIVGATLYDMPQMVADGSATQMFDYFNYIKASIIKVLALFIVLDFGASFFTETNNSKIDFKKINLKTIDKKYIFAILMVASVIIAFFVSDYKKIASLGAYERFEGMWIHFSYIIIFIYALKVFKKLGAFDVVTYATLLSTFIVGGIGTLQFLNVDVFNSEFMKALTYKNYDIQITMPGSFTTMYNTNTSGAYALLMMFLLAVIFVITKKTYVKAIAVLDFVLVTITFLNSYSEASYIAFLAGLGVLLIVYLVVLLGEKNYKKFGIITIFAVVVFIGTSIVALSNVKVQGLVERFIGPVATFTDWKQDENNFYFYNKDDDYLEFELLDNEYNIYEGDNLIFTESYDTSDIDVLTTLSTENFGDEVQVGITTSSLDNENYINFNNYFYIRYGETPAIVDMNTLSEAVHYDSIGFEGYGNLFTNRGYIWSYSIPLVFQHPFGIGSDVFFKVFPNDNFVAEAFYNQPDVTVDKPHDLYLDMAINNGIMYLIGFIGIVVLSFKDKFKLILSYENVNKKAIAIYIAGASTFLVNVLATDSLVILTLLFWLYLAFSNEFFIKEYEYNRNKAVASNKNVKSNEKIKSSKNKNAEISKVIEKDVVLNVEVEEPIKYEDEDKKEETSEEINYDEIGISYKDILTQDKNKKF